jgi:hypothetical protein
MKLFIGILFAMGFSAMAFAAEATTPANTEDSAIKLQSSGDYFDESDPGQVRGPASIDGLPASEDDVQKNSPDAVTPKNMPIDQE